MLAKEKSSWTDATVAREESMGVFYELGWNNII
jgi:hypothetical protein